MNDLVFSDFRHALRNLSRAPGFSLAVVATLGLGVGATAALFCLFNAVTLRMLPVRDPSRLAAVSRLNAQSQVRWIPVTTVAEFERQQHIFTHVCGYAGGAVFTATANKAVSAATVEFVTGRYHEVLDVRPALGRLLSPADAPLTGAPNPVAVLGYRFWERTFNSDPHALGGTLEVESVPFTIVGVAARGAGVQTDVAADIALPLAFLDRLYGDEPNPAKTPQANYIIGRLRDNLTPEQARAELQRVWPAVQAESIPAGMGPAEQVEFKSARAQFEPLATGFSFLRTRYAIPLRLLVALTAAMLALACLNLSGLFLARAAARESEMLVRLMLGAGRNHLVRQAFSEIVVLTLLGSALAMPLAWWTAQTIARVMWNGVMPMTLDVTPDLRVLGLMAGMVVMTTVSIGALPAWMISRSPALMPQGTRSVVAVRSRSRRVLVVAQVALSLALLFAAGLLTRSLSNLRAIDPGFDPRRVLTAKLIAQPGGYRDINESIYYPELVARLAALPGVQSVSLSHLFPTIVNTAAVLKPVARPDAGGTPSVRAAVDVVSPAFFRTVGIRREKGRAFSWDDDAKHPPVAVVNSSLASRLFPDGGAVGARIRVGTSPQSLQIVGVVGDACLGDLRASHVPTVFRPSLQQAAYVRSPAVEIRTAGDPTVLGSAVRRTVTALGREYVLTIRTLEEQIDGSIARERVAASLSSFLGGLAALLAGVGTFGLLAHTVARRRREIGVRMALGATRRTVVRSLVHESLALTTVGLAIGIPLAVAAGRLTRTLLVAVGHLDFVALASAAILLITVGVLASVIPAVRAANVDPATALRNE